MSKEDFWGKKDTISMARSLRLAVTQNVFDQDLITEEQARDVLRGPLSPGDEPCDDSDCLELRKQKGAA